MSFSEILNKLNKKREAAQIEPPTPPQNIAEDQSPESPQPSRSKHSDPLPEPERESRDNLNDAIELFESIREIVGEDDELIAIPGKALLRTLPSDIRGEKWNGGDLPSFSMHLDAQTLMQKLQSGKVVYSIGELQSDLPEGLVSAEADRKVALDLATVYSAVPPKLIQISSRISAAMEQVMDMPDYFSAKPGAIGTPADNEQTEPAAPALEDETPAPASSETLKPTESPPIQQPVREQSASAATVEERVSATEDRTVLKPANHAPRFENPWSGREPSNASVSPTDINSASTSELSKIPSVGPKIAEQILRYRDIYGGLESIYDLLSIPGIGVKNFIEMTGLDPEKRIDRSLTLNRMLGIGDTKTPRLPQICTAIAEQLNAKSCMLAGLDGMMISKSHGVHSDRAEECGALAPKIFRGTKKYLGRVEGANTHMLALPAANPPLLFIALDNLYMVLATYSTENITDLTMNIERIAGELNWLFSNRAVVSK